MLKWKIEVMDELRAAGYGFKELKKSGKISQYTLVNLNHGKVNVSTKTIDAICELLGCQPGDLLEYVEEP